MNLETNVSTMTCDRIKTIDKYTKEYKETSPEIMGLKYLTPDDRQNN